MILRLIAVVVLTVSCASLPIDDQGQQTEAADTQTSNTDPFSLQSGPEGQPETAAPQDDGDDSPVSVDSSWFKLAPSTLAEWLIVAITFGAVAVGWRTLGILRDQVRATADNAAAAKTSANAAKTNMYLSLRARIGLAKVVPKNFGPNQDTSIGPHTPEFRRQGRLPC